VLEAEAGNDWSLEAVGKADSGRLPQANKFWFSYLRLYARTQSNFDRNWPLPEIEKVK
jgi:hypothetical protein